MCPPVFIYFIIQYYISVFNKKAQINEPFYPLHVEFVMLYKIPVH